MASDPASRQAEIIGNVSPAIPQRFPGISVHQEEIKDDARRAILLIPSRSARQSPSAPARSPPGRLSDRSPDNRCSRAPGRRTAGTPPLPPARTAGPAIPVFPHRIQHFPRRLSHGVQRFLHLLEQLRYAKRHLLFCRTMETGRTPLRPIIPRLTARYFNKRSAAGAKSA